MQRIKLITLLLACLVLTNCNNKQQNKVENINGQEFENEPSGLPQDEAIKVLNFSNGKKIYVRAKIWGISSNHEEIVLSETPINIPNKEKDYIFYTDEVFYKIENSTLKLYAPQSGKNFPQIQYKDIDIVFKGLKTASEIKDYHLNYEKYGLERISINE